MIVGRRIYKVGKVFFVNMLKIKHFYIHFFQDLFFDLFFFTP